MGWKCQWTNWSFPMDKKVQINDPIYGIIEVCYPLNEIIATPEFQRLRNIKQLGCVYLVYPSANHSRFTHSLGVFHLAKQMVSYLSSNFPHLNITPNEQLCVCIAALIHDLGHGPFSHMFESQFLRQMNFHFEHEKMSRDIFQYMLEKDNGKLKKKLDEFLEKEDFEFIYELIKPPKDFLKNNQWTLKGRPREKAFLYQIVAEPISGLDVDKIDYLLRDSFHANVSINLNLAEWHRFLGTVNVSESEGFLRICHSDKIKVQRIFESRKQMHEIVYRHKTTVAFEISLIELFKLADPYLEFSGKDGKKYRMSTAHLDPEAFCKLDDSVLSIIKYLDNPGLEVAKRILKEIDERKMPKFVKKVFLSLDGTVKNYSEVEKEIETGLAEYCEGLKIYVKVQSFDLGQGIHHSPLKSILQFGNKDPNQLLKEPISTMHDPTYQHLLMSGGALCAYFFVNFDDVKHKEKAKEMIQKYASDHRKYFPRTLSPNDANCLDFLGSKKLREDD